MYKPKKQRDRKRLRRNNHQSTKEMREAISLMGSRVEQMERLEQAEKNLKNR